MQRLSIIVPLTGDLKPFEDTLVSVLENQPERSEVVVVLNEPYDDPYQLRGEVEFVEAPAGGGPRVLNLIQVFENAGLDLRSLPYVGGLMLIAIGLAEVTGLWQQWVLWIQVHFPMTPSI